MTRKPFLTPPSLPEGTLCRTLEIPDDKLWLGIFNSALLELIYPYNYEQVHETDLTPDEVAAACYQILEEYFETTDCVAGVPTPYWDDAEDLDDEESPLSQLWYGEVSDPEAAPAELDFIENAAIWAFTGFIALSGQIGAAVFFHTIAPNFVLSLKRGDIGEVVRVIIDAVDYGTYDTASVAAGEVLDIPLLPDANEGGHDIYIVRVE